MLKQAKVFKSLVIVMDRAVNKVVFQEEHLTAVNKNWPEFYIFMTRSYSELLSGDRERVRDGLMYSEYGFRNIKSFSLM